MRHLAPRIVLFALLLSPIPSAAATDAEKCISAKENAAGTYARCRLRAEAQFAKTGDAEKLATSLTRCGDQLAKSFAKADDQHGAECPTTEDATVEGFLGAASDQLVAYLANGSPEPGAGFCGVGTVLEPVSGECVARTLLSSSPISPEGYSQTGVLGSDAWTSLPAMPTARH